MNLNIDSSIDIVKKGTYMYLIGSKAFQLFPIQFPILTRNMHAQSMPRAEEIYPEICKLISVVTTCSRGESRYVQTSS